MPQKVLQPSFSGGVVAPALWSRTDLAKYATSLRTAKNFYIHAHGGASNRQGTEFIAAAKYADKACRLVPFEFSLEQAYSLEFGDKYARFFKDGAIIPINTANISDFNPATRYLTTGPNCAKFGPYAKITVNNNRYLVISAPYGVTPPANLHIVAVPPDTYEGTAYAAGSVYYNAASAFGYPLVGLVMDVTQHQGQSVVYAKHLQESLRAKNAIFANWTISQSDDYFRGVDPGAIPGFSEGSMVTMTAYSKVMRAVLDVTVNSGIAASSQYWSVAATIEALANTNRHPAFEPTYWADVTNGSPYEVVTPYLETELHELKFSQSADILYIAHPSYCPRLLMRMGEGMWATESFDFTNGPFMPSNIVKAQTLTVSATTGTGKTLTAASALFDTSTPSKHIGSLWQIRHDIEGQKISSMYTSVAATVVASIKCGKTWRLITHGNWGGNIQVNKSTDGGVTWKSIRSFSSLWSAATSTGDFNVNTYGDVDEPCLVAMTCTAYTAGTCNFDLTSDGYEHTGIVKITAVASSTSATCDVLTEVGATTAVWDWSEGSWSNFRGWPRAVTFHEDRLCFAGTNSEPQTTWTTKTGNYTDFGRSVPLVDSDGISVNLSARKMSGIKHLISLNGMAAMTSATEWSIGYDTNLTPTNTPQKCAGYNGCSDVAPVMVGDRVLYFSPMGSMLKDMAFSLEANGFKSDDMTVMASHLFNGYSIVDMAYQQEPDKLLWCVRSDGKILTMTYMREQEVFAWTEHNTDGEFESVCSIPGDGYNEVWFVVKRFINGAAVRYIERLVQRMDSTEPADQMFVDCGKVIVNASPTTAVTGLTHLIGETVAVLADGNVVNGLTVSNTGTITLPEAATKVIVGLPYVCDFETLNVEMNLNTGTTQGSRVKIAKVVVRFLNSRGGKLGPNADSLDTVDMNENIDVTLVEPLHTVDFPMTIQSGYDIGGRIFFRQSDPLPTTILAVIPEVTVGG